MCNIYYNLIYFAVFFNFNVYFLIKNKSKVRNNKVSKKCVKIINK